MQSEFKILKVSHGTAFFSQDNHRVMLANSLASVHPDTLGKGTSNTTQYQHFINAQIGDLVFICRSNEVISAIGMLNDNRPLYSLIDDHYAEAWVDRSYTPLFDAKNSSQYDKSGNKWWKPGNNSTCIEVKSDEFIEFENEILKPVFDITLNELIRKRFEVLSHEKISINQIRQKQKRFKEYFRNEKLIFDDLNNLSKIERLKVFYEYGNKVVEKSPVVWLRQSIIQFLSENDQPLTLETFIEKKDKIGKQFQKNVFHAWKSPVRVLYPLVYASTREQLNQYIKEIVIRIQEDLNIEKLTKFKIVDLDGPQNQGFDRVWVAIYNNTHKSQKTAKQLFFEINDSFKYGLLSLTNPPIQKLKVEENFTYENILLHFQNFVQEIINDDISKYETMIELQELLTYKKQIILQGPPGTGKTYTAKDLAEYMLLGEINSDKKVQSDFIDNQGNIEIIQFHPAYTYEDFIRGIITEPFGDKINYISKDKLFLELVNRANNDPNNPYILIIDEINRANLSAVLGELIYALEYRGQSFKSMYANKEGDYEIRIPENLYIIGTMNTADRSVGHIDYALRRRFAFYDVLPKIINEDNFEANLFITVSSLFVKEIRENVNELIASEHISVEFKDRPQDIWLGHSYFFSKPDQDFSIRVRYEIVPILQEYVKDGILNNSEEVQNIIKSVLKYQPADVNS